MIEEVIMIGVIWNAVLQTIWFVMDVQLQRKKKNDR
jgi:hypothetical protein